TSCPCYHVTELQLHARTQSGTNSHSAHDPDIGSNALQAYKLSQTPFFRLETDDSGDEGKIPFLVLQRALDRERSARHNLVLTAVDGGKPQKTGTLSITVVVSDVNDNAPVCSQPKYTATVREDASDGAFLLHVNATDADEGPNGEIEYSLRNKFRNGASDLFELDSKTGELWIKGALDFEEKQVYEIKIVASDKGAVSLSTQCNVLVKVEDVNDNPPEIDVTSLTGRIPEDAPPGTVVALMGVTDLDSGVNGQTICSLPKNIPFELIQSSDSNFYSLVNKENVDKESKPFYDIPVTLRDGDEDRLPSLVLQKYLDRESAFNHNLLLTAVDGGNPPKSGNLKITITVLDTNDNQPVCSQDMYTTSLYENVSVGTVILKVNATDPDDGNNGEVEYSWGTNTNNNIQDIFQVHRITGEVRVKKEIDFEDIQTYRLNIQATDKGQPPLSVDCRVTIRTIDVNDNKPEIEVTSILTNVPEDSKPGTVISLISVTDKDSGINGQIVCSLSNDVAFELKSSIEDNMYSLITKGHLDRERVSQYEIVLTAKDLGQPSLSTLKTLIVEVSDVNDNSPEFLQNPLELYLTENNVPGLPIFSVSATDKDLNENGAVTYQIVRGDAALHDMSSFLNMNSETGVIYALKSFDFEIAKTFRFHVLATDLGIPPLSSNLTVNVFILDQNDNVPIHYVEVEITDINDNSPAFTEKDQLLEIPESSPPGEDFQLQAAQDADFGTNSVKFYKLSQTEYFELELRDNGGERKIPILKLRQSLDREKQNRHNLILTAVDGGNPPRSGSININITVLDDNDNRPKFTQELYSVTVEENSPVGTVVVKVNATDIDEGLNGEIVYSFVKNLDKHVYDTFALDINTGEIRIKGKVDFEINNVYRVGITASDKGQPPKARFSVCYAVLLFCCFYSPFSGEKLHLFSLCGLGDPLTSTVSSVLRYLYTSHNYKSALCRSLSEYLCSLRKY
uniref:Cadherin domain-containing protein n=1 Tax=Electrophorus electricus TaxID=8005 RepID=A0AAY5EP39_ELEEL